MGVGNSFNRTIVELKRAWKEKINEEEEVLIEPLWN